MLEDKPSLKKKFKKKKKNTNKQTNLSPAMFHTHDVGMRVRVI
jgi:hypothetical protein